MSIDKALYEAPQGLGSLQEAEPLEIEIVDPEEVNISGPGFEMHMGKAEKEFDCNLAEDMDENVLKSLAYELLEDVEEDMRSRKDWLDIYIKGLKLLGLKYEERSEPWPGASGVFHPLLMESAVKFQAELIMETFPAAGPVRTEIIGKETQETRQAAQRVEADMNYTLTEVMTDYRPEHERLLLATAICGNAFKKIYYNPSIDLPEAPFISAEDIIVPYGAANIDTAERITHRMRKTPNEIRKLQVAGFYLDVDLGDPVRVMDEVEKQKAEEQGLSATIDDRFQLLEIHANLDLEGYEDTDKHGLHTGIALPYVVTIEKGTGTVLAIRRNWVDGDKLKQRRQHFVHYGYIPGFGFYSFGLIHLVGGHTHTATSLLRQLIDAGTLSNLPGGLKAKGLRVKGDDTPIAPGEFRDVDLPSGAIRDNILMLPYKEPSQVLMALMDKVVADGRQFAATADLNVSDMSAQAPVGTTLAILERVLKVTTAVQARIHFTMKQEFKLLAAIIRDNTPEDYDYDPESGDRGAKRSDYDMVNVLPVSDPNASTMAQRVVQYQAVIQLAQQAPQIYDLPYLHKQMIEILGVKNADKIIPTKDDMQPVDPISENMAMMNNKPVKAFMYQDHAAHLQVHMAMLHDPSLAQTMGQNPMAQQIMAALNAHIMEHVAYKYRGDIEHQLGVALPPPPQSVTGGPGAALDPSQDPGYLDPQEEVKVSRLAALAAQQLLNNNQAQAQQQQIQQQMQDPIIQMQQQELQLKQQQLQMQNQQAQAELQIKQQQVQLESQVKQLEMQIKAQQFQLESQLKQGEAKRKAMKDVTDATAKSDDLELRTHDVMTKHQIEGAKMGLEVAKHKAEQHHKGVELGVDVAKHRAEMHHSQLETGVDALKHMATMQHQKEQAEAAQEAQQQQQQSQESQQTEE